MAKISLKDLPKYLKGATLDKYKKALEKSIQPWAAIAKEEAKLLIVETIQRGQSPVKSGRGQTGESARFTDYSPLYKKVIESARKNTGRQRPGRRRKMGSILNVMAANGKRLRPVNLTLTGEMLRSIKSRSNKDGFSIWFSDKKAKYHTVEGAGKSKIKRKMLPVDRGDEFTRLIMKGIADRFKQTLSKNLGR
jgi:hypothetical protein